nr:ribonuclease H-like domain-containing protein [Tanacetum cinerariifolium]
TPQQNGVSERKNRTLIEAAKTMLTDSKLPTTFWAEAVNTAYYVQNRVLVIKPHNMTPYELFYGRTPSLSFMKAFGCPVTILNTLDPLGTKDNVVDENRVYGCADDSNIPNLEEIVYLDDDEDMCTEFEKMMHKKFQMSSMGELTFFLGLFQVTPNVLHLHVVKRIFRYLKGQSKLGLWYPKDLFNLEAYTDSDYAGASLDKSPQQELKVNVVRHKLTTVVDVNDVEVLGYCNGQKHQWRVTDTRQGGWKEDEVVYEKMHDSVERAASTATSLDWGIISKTQFTTTLNEPSYIETSSGSGPKRQETIRDAAAQTRSERVSKFSNDPPLLRTGLAKEIANLKKGVKRLERKKKSRSHGLKRLYKVGLSERVESSTEEECLGKEESSKQGRIEDIDDDDNITLVNDQEMFDADRDLQDITTTDIEETISTATLITTDVTDDELTVAQALVEIKKSKPNGATTTTTIIIPTLDSTRPKARGVVRQELSETPTTTTTIPKSSKVQDKGKAEIDEQDRLLEEKAQLIEDEILSWDNVQAMMDADYELVARLQEEEQGELTIEEKSRLFVELIDKRKNHFSKLRAEEQIRKPPTKA